MLGHQVDKVRAIGPFFYTLKSSLLKVQDIP